MSAIGDYIHLTYTGYVKGPELGSGKPPFFESYGSALMNRENHFNQWVQKQESSIIKNLENELQKSLNLLKNFRDNKGNTNLVESNEMAMALLDDLWEELDTKYVTVDRVAAAASGLLNESGFGSGRNIGRRAEKTVAQTATITNINQQIQNLLDRTLSEINDAASQIFTKQELKTSEVFKVISKTQKNINNFMNNLQSHLNVLDTSSEKRTLEQINKIFNELKTVIQNNDKLNSNINIESKLNTLAKGLSGGLQSKQYKGDISEALVSVIGERMSGVAMKDLDVTIKEAMVSGQERSARGIVTGNFISDIDWNTALAGRKFKQPFGEDFIVSADAVQDKVDIKIEVEGGNHAYISAKNYNTKTLERGVTNTSASFLTLIQNENKNDIINHYLNLNGVTGRGRQSLRASVEEVNNFIRKITIAKLITGYHTITDSLGGTMAEANVFAVFNSDNYTVKLYNMKDVLDSVFNRNRYQKMFIPSYFYKNNLKTTNYETRISNLIKQLNVSVSYTLREEEYARK